jgi:gamma-glutamyltranspeptidase/glutathione hydrolase
MTGSRIFSPAVFVILLTGSAHAQVDRITGQPFATRSEVLAQHGMVCTSHPLATQIGVEVLKAGGSAVDAALAANAALGLMEPMSCGIGGDLFAIVWNAKDRKLHGLNASGRSPLGLSYDQMKAELTRLNRTTIPSRGLMPISVPGCVDGWFELHGKFGRLPMSQVLAPAIRYAREGFPVTEVIAYYWKSVRLYDGLPGAALSTWAPGGKPPRRGRAKACPSRARRPGLDRDEVPGERSRPPIRDGQRAGEGPPAAPEQ